MKIKCLSQRNKKKTVLFALPYFSGYNLNYTTKYDPEIYLDAMNYAIQSCIEQGKCIFLSQCRNELEFQFCLQVIQFKKEYPKTKIVFITNDWSSKEKKKTHDLQQFDGWLNLYEEYKNDDDFQKYLLSVSSTLIGVFRDYELKTRQLCKIAKAKQIEIINLIQDDKEPINKRAVLQDIQVIFGTNVDSEKIAKNTKIQCLMNDRRKILNGMSNSKNIEQRVLLSKIQKLHNIHKELQREISGYYFLSNIK
ncbi:MULTISPECIES: hypothetical protein [Clostridiaceae]|uniref:Uncharacterized protein n=1 Tax=Clostridium facile TaxID=2763035 RepID=A0ABR7IQF5_9CLOT|nr:MULTISPECIES: hypothetical protein [Clostridiaceae]MBC5787077.1 hypothetical protein [Clostridium facile]